jgi:dCTP deaminase
MSILSKPRLLEALQKGEIMFEPGIDAFQLSAATIDLRVGWSFYIPERWKYTDKGRVAIQADYSDSAQIQDHYQLIKIKPGQYFEILPGESIIVAALEKITINSGLLMGMLYPRSSAARRGLTVDSGVIDPYFSGNLVIPLRNNNDHVVRIFPGERICQVQIHELSHELTKDDATKKGLNDPKYYATTPYNLGVKPDPQEEMDLLRAGNIDGLKEKYKLTPNA